MSDSCCRGVFNCLCIPSSWRGAWPTMRPIYQWWYLAFTESLPAPDIVLQDLYSHLPSQNLWGTHCNLSLINVWWKDKETSQKLGFFLFLEFTLPIAGKKKKRICQQPFLQWQDLSSNFSSLQSICDYLTFVATKSWKSHIVDYAGEL